jgi:hypothetical protein
MHSVGWGRAPRVALLAAVGVLIAALNAFACGPGNDKPPLTPDSDHPGDTMEGGAPSTPSAPSTPTAPAK